MRRTFILAGGSAVLAALVACATSDDGSSSFLPDSDAGSSAVPEAAAPAEGGAWVRDAGGPTISWCSDAGWCATTLPDPDLTLTDIWPFDERAFAIAESQTLGTKVLEWTEATESWAYIDDNSQNAYGQGQYAGKIWAPNENEIYYGVAPSFLYHGTRATPSSPWTWESTRLEYSGRDFGPERDPGRPRYAKHSTYPEHYPALGVWGTSGDDVYAWYANTIFHRKSEDGGAPTWVPEYVAEDSATPDDAFFIFAAAGSSSDDVFFAGGRGRYNTGTTGVFPCTIVVRRTPDEYRRIVDHTINPAPEGTCRAKAGAVQFRADIFVAALGGNISLPITNPGWLTSIASPRPGAVVGILDRTNLGYIGSDGAGSALLNPVGVRGATYAFDPLLSSIWIHGDTAWLSGWGLVLEAENNPNAFAAGQGLRTAEELVTAGVDGGATYSISTTVLNGAPLDRSLLQVRGSSNTNLWAVGPRYALHKTTP
ncbi:MAG: hypothetical protein KF795_03980 [Labilithrix sp.]|nr:hypothetical protein [Labilithrix sp.]